MKGANCQVYSHIFRKSCKKKFFGVDVSSLFPKAAMVTSFPIGKPRRWIGRRLEIGLNIHHNRETLCPAGKFRSITENINENNGLEIAKKPIIGFLHCQVLPPKNLFNPVLMHKTKANKMVSALCYTCANNEQSECQHDPDQRSINGVWTTDEINYSVIQCGYVVREIFEVLSWPKTMPLLKNFISVLARRKILASKLPENLSASQLEAHVSDLNADMGFAGRLKMKVEEFSNCPLTRHHTKLSLNSFLGVFAMQRPKTMAKLVFTKRGLYDAFFSSTSQITKMKPISQNCLMVISESTQEHNSKRGNVHSYFPIYAFVVSKARLIMHSDLEVVQRVGKLYYSNCDSAYFSVPTDTQFPFKLSEAFGCYKHEHSGDIESFTAKTDRSYSVTVSQSGRIKECIKMTGLSMEKFCVKQQLSLDEYDKLVLNELHGIPISKKIIQPKATAGGVDTMCEFTIRNSKYRKRYLKLQPNGDIDSFPYGFIETKCK
jgi:hypothetical protein